METINKQKHIYPYIYYVMETEAHEIELDANKIMLQELISYLKRGYEIEAKINNKIILVKR